MDEWRDRWVKRWISEEMFEGRMEKVINASTSQIFSTLLNCDIQIYFVLFSICYCCCSEQQQPEPSPLRLARWRLPHTVLCYWWAVTCRDSVTRFLNSGFFLKQLLLDSPVLLTSESCRDDFNALNVTVTSMSPDSLMLTLRHFGIVTYLVDTFSLLRKILPFYRISWKSCSRITH